MKERREELREKEASTRSLIRVDNEERKRSLNSKVPPDEIQRHTALVVHVYAQKLMIMDLT